MQNKQINRQRKILCKISAAGDSWNVTNRVLSRELGVNKDTLRRDIRYLETNGYVHQNFERSKVGLDRILCITEKGKHLIKEMTI